MTRKQWQHQQKQKERLVQENGTKSQQQPNKKQKRSRNNVYHHPELAPEQWRRVWDKLQIGDEEDGFPVSSD